MVKSKRYGLVIVACLMFVLLGLFFVANDKVSVVENSGSVSASAFDSKQTPTITHEYENNTMIVVYDGEAHMIEASVSNGQPLKIMRESAGLYFHIVNQFTDVGIYDVFVTSEENYAFNEAEYIPFLVIVKPNMVYTEKTYLGLNEVVVEDNNKGFEIGTKIETMKSGGRNVKLKTSVYKDFGYTFKPVDAIRLSFVNNDKSLVLEKTATIKLVVKDEYKRIDFKMVELTKSGSLIEHEANVVDGYVVLDEVNLDSVFAFVVEKSHPYLWIIVAGCLIAVLIILTICWFCVKRKIKFIIDNKVVKITRVKYNGTITIPKGLENYEWFKTSNLIVKYNTSKKTKLSSALYSSLKCKKQ